MAFRLPNLEFDIVQSGTLDLHLTSPRQGIEIINESTNGIAITVPYNSDSYEVPPQHKRIVIFPNPYDEVYWKIDYSLAASNAPANLAIVRILTTQEVQDAIDAGSIDVPLSARQANVGNQQGLTVSNTPSIINNNNPAGSTIIETQPDDQTSAAILATNDGALLWQLLSQNQQLNILNFVRGSQNTKANVTIGDQTDPSILTVHGTADNAAQAGQAQSAVTANQAQNILMNDGSLSNQISVPVYSNTTDPSTYTVPPVGAIWYEG